ncbi:MAG: SDR family oxidoreductase [Gammaproteobacteria bacterium]|jgi:NAD(P)-dependent dehydrogenase (short-subunit alcohol dehydrogenase family)|nr:SDR family oxidoreductase [Gammaproteobacteria bacterium]
MKAVVTGAGAGLGASIAERLASEGYAVALLDQDGDAASRRAEELTGASAFQVDVSNPEQVADVFSRIGAVDLLVNNAGIARFGPLLEQSPADMQAVINVNLMGTALCAQQAAKQMAEQGAGCIINLSSINAVTPGPNVGLYAATKAAVHNLTILQALEWGPMGVRVNAIAPGFIDAGMSAPFFEQASVREKRSGGVPLKRLGQADDVVNAVVYLQSEAAQYVSGHQLVVDGGVVGSLLAHLPRD